MLKGPSTHESALTQRLPLTMRAPRFSVTSIECFERPVSLRLPFRFGAATVRDAAQAFVRATIRGTDGRVAQGMTAELMIPKWFDKSPQRSNADNVDDLRQALDLAASAYCADSAPRSAFGHSSFNYSALHHEGDRRGLNALTTSYGGALADRAILDALCRLHGISFFDAMRDNAPGIDAGLTPELARFDLDAFLSGLRSHRVIAARHTVGMADPLTRLDVDPVSAPNDGLPVALTDVIALYGNHYFKLKLRGDARADIARLVDIAAVLDELPEYRVTLDGNEQFRGLEEVAEFVDAVAATPALSRLCAAVLYLEQPLPRGQALHADLRRLSREWLVIIDESDATLDAFAQAHARGYAGVSSKSCKGVYKSLLNAARCVLWNANGPGSRSFMTGEDLTAQPGLALQQDLALAGLLGLTHVERNGHHYAAGFSGQHAPPDEQKSFLGAHLDLYEQARDLVRLRIRGGAIALSSLAVPGFSSQTWPDPATLAPIHIPAQGGVDSQAVKAGAPI